uniref:AB hydrolase-1 domain-containing protein n=1 Tax=Glycine max TaxID=3847 RepID=A0A0R0HES0_SOYBN
MIGKHFLYPFHVDNFREPGRVEADFDRFPVKSMIRNIYTIFSRSEIPIAADDQEIMDLFDPSTPLPPWTSKVETGLSDVKVTVPALLIMGEKDYFLMFLGMEDYIRNGAVTNFVPDLETVYIPEGSHFVHEQIPEKVNQQIIEFLDKQSI